MNLTRQQKLMAATAAAVVVWVVYSFIGPTVLAPFQERGEKLERLTNAVRTKTQQADAVDIAQAKLRDWRARSLPPDENAKKAKRPEALVAQRKYQEWITDLTLLAGFDNPSIKPTGTGRVGKNNAYVSVTVTVEGEVTYGQLATFLDHFYRTNLLHRISRLEVSSRESTGDPLMKVLIEAEGLALTDVPPRRTLFAETTLSAPFPADASTVEVAGNKDFPQKPPFRVRIGTEYLTVTAIDGKNWTCTRAVERTRAKDHPAGAVVEFTPLNPNYPSKTQDEFREVLAANPFIKPPPPIKYELKLGPLGEQAFVRGKTFEFAIPVTGYDPTHGKPEFVITAGSPPGLQIDRGTGKITWKPADGQAVGKFPLSLEIRHPSAENGLKKADLTVVFREPNTAPTLKVSPPPVAYLGREWTFLLDVSDPETPREKLTIKLENAPEGLTVSLPAGELKWKPPESLKPGDFNVKVDVTDDGTPPQTVSANLTLKLQDDAAQFTILAGIVTLDEQRQAWLRDQLQDKNTYLRVGDKLTIADITGTIAEIKPKFLVLKQGEQMLRLELGENLRQLRPASEG